MAAPTSPSLSNLVTEALKKGGYATPSAALVTRASDYWMEEIKNDIWTINKRCKNLQTTSVAITTENQARYSCPSDYASDLTVTLMHGTTRGTAQTGAAGSITLEASEDVTSDFILGKNILIYDGTAKGNMSQCTAYNSTTKVATIVPDWNTTPNSTSKYMVVDTYYPLEQKPIWEYDNISTPTSRGTPEKFYPIGDPDYGEFILYPIPHHTSDIPFGIQFRYYANLMKLDLAGTLMATLYQKWREVFTAGIVWKAYEDMDDSRADTQRTFYRNMLSIFNASETYGLDLSNLQAKVDA